MFFKHSVIFPTFIFSSFGYFIRLKEYTILSLKVGTKLKLLKYLFLFTFLLYYDYIIIQIQIHLVGINYNNTIMYKHNSLK